MATWGPSPFDKNKEIALLLLLEADEIQSIWPQPHLHCIARAGVLPV